MSGSRSTGGREFQDDGPDDENACGPRVTVRGTYSMAEMLKKATLIIF